MVTTETPAALAEAPEIGPLCECGCGEHVSRDMSPAGKGQRWRRYANKACASKQGKRDRNGSTSRLAPTPARAATPAPRESQAPVAVAAPWAMPDHAPVGLPAFVGALTYLAQLTPPQRQAAMAAVAALEVA